MHTIIPTIERTEQGLVVSSETIAEGTDNQHKNVLQLIRTYRDDLNEFGTLESETRPFIGADGRTQHREIFHLNEPQSTLLLTYMRNMDRIRVFKKALVRAFYEMARQLQAPPSGERLLALAVLEAQQMLEAKDEQIAELSPKAAAWESVVSSAGSWSYNDAAKVLCNEGEIRIGEKRLVNELITWGHLYRDRKGRPHVYQRFLEQGLYTVKARTYRDMHTGEVRESSAPQVRITGKGLDMIRTRLLDGVQLRAVV
ncbi:MAG: phage antirepressor KilAC domain-containing protein [Micrococcaceae bacterium]